MARQLNRNQFVVFDDGHKEGYLEARWSERSQAFYTFTDDGEKIFSTTVIERPKRKKRKFVPSAKNCTVLINPYAETEKAYIVEDGSNGCITRGNIRTYDKYIAKSICFVDEDGKIYAPIWA